MTDYAVTSGRLLGPHDPVVSHVLDKRGIDKIQYRVPGILQLGMCTDIEDLGARLSLQKTVPGVLSGPSGD